MSSRIHLRSLLILLGIAALPLTAPAAEDPEAERLDKARVAFQEIRGIPDAEIPDELLSRCRCIAVIPGVYKGALGWGARMGRGVISCRSSAGRWSPPSFLTLGGGSIGLQIGVERADVVLFVMNERGARTLIATPFTLGAKGGVAAGPVGRTAEGGTDIQLNAEIYTYARSKGLFAGISLEGARLSSDRKAIRRFYGADLTPEAILFESKVSGVPPVASRFLETLPVSTP